MRKRLIALLLCLCLLSACAAPTAEPDGYVFTDSDGSRLCVDKPRKTAVLFSSFAQVWTLAGGSVDITVGETIARGFAAADTPLVDRGAGKSIDHELLLAAQPDLVIGSADIPAQVQACRIAAEAGIPAALFRVDTFEDYLSMLKIFTELLENPTAYEQYGTAVEAEIKDILSTPHQAGTYLLLRTGSTPSATKAKRAPENFVCRMLDELGGQNIADHAAVLSDGLSVEEILLQDPDHIFLTAMGDETAAKAYAEDLFRQEGWRTLTAVKTGNYTFLPKELFHYKPNHQWAKAYAMLAQILSRD